MDAADGIGGEELGILTPAPSKAPRINGARVYGVRPGRPILWRAAVTGMEKVSTWGEKCGQCWRTTGDINDSWDEAGGEVWAKPMSDGSIAVALFNSGRRKAVVSADLARLGLAGEWRVRDLWRQKDEGVVTGAYSAEVPRHCTKLVRLFPREGAGLKPCVRDIRNASSYGQFESKRPLGKPGYGSSEPCPDCPKNRAGRNKAQTIRNG